MTEKSTLELAGLRWWAKKKAKTDDAEVREAIAPEEARLLLHKLRVRQMELEVQNEALQKHVADLNATNKELESYGHFISHDLRTPLRFTNRIARSLLQEQESPLSNGAVEQVNAILLATSEMENLVENLLLFSQASRMPIRKHRMDPRELFESAVQELESTEERGRVEIVIQDMAPCHGDRSLLKEVAVNLLANALKFTRPRDPARITIGCTRTEAETVYFVEDNGVGFHMRDADALFVPFRRLHKAEDFEGTGVGLALVRRIIERHGGRIWAEGEVGKGTTFYFTLGDKALSGTAAKSPFIAIELSGKGGGEAHDGFEDQNSGCGRRSAVCV